MKNNQSLGFLSLACSISMFLVVVLVFSGCESKEEGNQAPGESVPTAPPVPLTPSRCMKEYESRAGTLHPLSVEEFVAAGKYYQFVESEIFSFHQSVWQGKTDWVGVIHQVKIEDREYLFDPQGTSENICKDQSSNQGYLSSSASFPYQIDAETCLDQSKVRISIGDSSSSLSINYLTPASQTQLCAPYPDGKATTSSDGTVTEFRLYRQSDDRIEMRMKVVNDKGGAKVVMMGRAVFIRKSGELYPRPLTQALFDEIKLYAKNNLTPSYGEESRIALRLSSRPSAAADFELLKSITPYAKTTLSLGYWLIKDFIEAIVTSPNSSSLFTNFQDDFTFAKNNLGYSVSDAYQYAVQTQKLQLAGRKY